MRHVSGKCAVWVVVGALLVLCSCSAARHRIGVELGLYSRFNTVEEMNEYYKKHGHSADDWAPSNAEDNAYRVLSWAREGMDESVMRDKIGAPIARSCLQSTHSSMGSTVHTYKFGDVDSSSGVVDVWLTFIDGKLESISTFR